MERLEVEDDKQRQRRIQTQLENLNKLPSVSSSRAQQGRNLLNFDFGNSMMWDVGPPTELLSRVQAFLPQIEASNAVLAQQVESNPESVNIEHIDEDKNQYIEMNLGLGVFEDRTRKQQGKNKVQRRHHQNTAQKHLSPASSSETSSSEHDARYDTDSSDPDTDSSSEIITSFERAPRLIRPLPRRSPASCIKPKIHVLNETKN